MNYKKATSAPPALATSVSVTTLPHPYAFQPLPAPRSRAPGRCEIRWQAHGARYVDFCRSRALIGEKASPASRGSDTRQSRITTIRNADGCWIVYPTCTDDLRLRKSSTETLERTLTRDLVRFSVFRIALRFSRASRIRPRSRGRRPSEHRPMCGAWSIEARGNAGQSNDDCRAAWMAIIKSGIRRF